jgi:hypothetical protein
MVLLIETERSTCQVNNCGVNNVFLQLSTYMSKKVGFAVIYRWRLHAGKEQQFRRAWEGGTSVNDEERRTRIASAPSGGWDLGGLRAVAKQRNLGAGP